MTHSLLSMVLQDEKVTSLLNGLRESVVNGKFFHIPDQDMIYMKKKFQEAMDSGEKGLHGFSFRLVESFATLSKAKTTLIVWGRCPDIHHPGIIKSYTNIELDRVLSSHYMDSVIAWSHSPVCSACQKKANTIASFNQYKLEEPFASGLRVLLSRIKTTSNICYKIADMVFDIDRMFKRDKIVNTYTQTLMDMYGIKMAFDTHDHIFQAIDFFRKQPDIKILTEKNYLGEHRKNSGYEAYKIVIQNNIQLFEVQFQTLEMLETERSTLNASHQTYKERQMIERSKIGDDYWNLYDVLIQMFAGKRENEKI